MAAHERIFVTVPGAYSLADTPDMIAAAIRRKYPDIEPSREGVKVKVAVYVGIPPGVSGRVAALMACDRMRPMGGPRLDRVLGAVIDAMRGLFFVSPGQVVSCGIIKRYLPKPALSIDAFEMDMEQGAI